MFANNIDTIIILSPVNRFYFSKIETSFGAIILHDDEKIFITDFRYESYARKMLFGWNIIIASGNAMFEAINQELVRLNAKVVGYEDTSISVAKFDMLKSVCGAFHFEPASDIIVQERIVKSADEISKISAAQVVAQKALSKVVPLIKPGITEREVSANILYEMQMLGAEGSSFETIVAFGANGACPHHKTSNRKLEKNEMVLIDMGAKMNGYCSDMTRTFCIGNPNPRMAEIHKIVLDAQEYALNNIKAGMTGHEADSFAREYITSHGFGREFGHSLGHGVGIEIHESPRLALNNKEVLKPGMIVTVEPGIYVEGLGGVRIEDMAVVQEDGLLNLTNFNKSIIL